MNAGYSCRVGVGQVPQLPEANGNLTRFWWWQYFIVSQSPRSLSGGIVWLGVTFNQSVDVLFSAFLFNLVDIAHFLTDLQIIKVMAMSLLRRALMCFL